LILASTATHATALATHATALAAHAAIPGCGQANPWLRCRIHLQGVPKHIRIERRLCQCGGV
jgi:hypothetical protein